MRLVGRDGKEAASGRLEVYVNNQWGMVGVWGGAGQLRFKAALPVP